MPTTQYMQLALPQPSVTPGPQYASLLNAALSALDGHSHAPGFGAPVPSAGINIDRALSFNGFDAVSLRSVRLANQGAPLALGTDVGCLYEAGGSLFFNNGSGQQVQITAGAALNGASLGSVGGDYSTSGASEVYVSASQTFQFFQAASKYANLDAGNVIIRQPGVTSPQGVTLKSPTSLAASYSLTLLAALPASTLPLSVDASGNLTAAQITNAQQNFGTPAAATDVVILSYLTAALTWTAPSLGTGWVNSATPVAYTKDVLGAVRMRGAATCPAGAGVIFTLPVGYRPAVTRFVVCGCQNFAGGYAQFSVDASTGNVTVLAGSNGNTYDLSAITFIAGT